MSTRAIAAALCVSGVLTTSCHSPQDKVRIVQVGASESQPKNRLLPYSGKIDAIPRYGGYVLTAQGMPNGEVAAYLWAKNTGSLVAFETFLRRYPDGQYAGFFRQEIRARFLPKDEKWHDAWLFYSRMELIDGAICDPKKGFILLGRPGSGRLSPFFYEDLIVALKCSLANERVGVTMNRIFTSRFKTPEDPREAPYQEYETSVDFYSHVLWNTHLAYVLFEGDRMLKSLGSGYDLFLREPIRSSIPGFATENEMEALIPRIASGPAGTKEYGRVWIELTTVKINTTEKKNTAMFGDVRLEVRAESKHSPPFKFAKHIRDNYKAYSQEFPIFGEIERAARVVALARWLTEYYPAVSRRLVETSHEQTKVFVPQVIPGKAFIAVDEPTYKSWLIGGVVFPNINKTEVAGQTPVGDTVLDDLSPKVLEARNGEDPAWEVTLGKRKEDKYVAWCVSAMQPGKVMSRKERSTTRSEVAER